MPLGKSTLALVGVSVLILFGVSIVLNGPRMVEAWRQKGQVEQVLQEFGKYLASKDYSRAHDLCTPEFREATPLEEFVRQQVKLCDSYGALSTSQVKGIEVQGTGNPPDWAAIASSELLFERRNVVFVIELHQLPTGWRIYGYRHED
jgi:hypothetical protein